MMVEIQIAKNEWRKVDATIDSHGWARVWLRWPYGLEVFKVWRKAKPAKRNGGRK